MNWRPLLAMMAILAPCEVRADMIPGWSQTAHQVASQMPSQACRQAVAAAERAHGIPPHLLAAIARVESGRRDQASSTFNPWPWTINFDGQGSFYESKADAVATAMSMRLRVTKSIDVGCMQISLTHHPDAFASMEQAFDPSQNADYGARFLPQLFEKSGSWPRAVEMYHSATPELGHDYGEKVYAALPEESKMAVAAEPALMPVPVASSFGSVMYHMMPLHQTAAHVLPRIYGPNGELPPGRTLDAYRASPIRVALRTPLSLVRP
jgi:hypothetical protein